MEDKLLTAIMLALSDDDLNKVDRIDITFGDGIIDINIESSEDSDDVHLEQMMNEQGELDTLNSMKIAMIISSFGEPLHDFIEGFYALIERSEKWIDVLEDYFEDAATAAKSNYCLKVVKK